MEHDQRMSRDRGTRVHQIAAYWNDEAASYDEQFDHTVGSPAEQAAWDRVFDLVTGGRQDLAVLDVGTGTGFLALALAERGHLVVGIDLSSEMLARARSKAAERGLVATFDQGDAERPSFPAESFDLVISRHLFWSLGDQIGTLVNWRRLLRPGGCLAILDGDWCPGAPADVGTPRSLTASEVGTIVEENGYVDVRIDDLADLSKALDARAERTGDSPARFARYLVTGYWPERL